MNNTEKCYKPDEIDLVNIVNFSEGSVALYDLLKYCHDNNIGTHACCKGHEDSQLPYIAFIVNDTDREMFIYVISQLFSYTIGYEADISTVENITKVTFYNSYITDDLFTYLLIFFKKYMNLENKNFNSDYNNVFDFLDLINSDNTKLDSSKDISISIRTEGLSIYSYEEQTLFLEKNDTFVKEDGYYTLSVAKETRFLSNIENYTTNDYCELLKLENSLRIDDNCISLFLEEATKTLKNNKIR